MPGVAVLADLLFKHMESEPIETEELRELLSSYGLELDDDTIEEGKRVLKIDVPANRPDLLSVEILGLALRIYKGKPFPEINIEKPKLQIKVESSTQKVRAHIICAVLHGVTFTTESYNSFIDYQDKLHQNLCRRRSLASIGTHDLVTVKPPFLYQAQPPEDIKFVPLIGGPVVDGRQLFDKLRQHAQLSKYLYLIENFPIWPVVRDSNGVVLSLPPIINSDHSKISLNTHEVFIECTATDFTRASIAVSALSFAFSMYSTTPFTIEQVDVVFDDKTIVTPNLNNNEFIVSGDYIRSLTGVNTLTDDVITQLLSKMMLRASVVDNQIKVIVGPTRSDILHPCDIAEDVAIAYGYKEIQKTIKAKVPSGRPLPIGEYVDRLRREIVGLLFKEILSFSLCSINENYKMIGLEEDGKAVRIQKAKTIEFEIVRTSLIAGLLKVNKKIQDQPGLKRVLPLRLFEISDVVLQDESAPNKAFNQKRLCATVADVKSRFEIVHGVLDRILVLNHKDQAELKLTREDSPTCIPGQRASITFKNQIVGWIGVIHPQVLINFDLTTPIVALEIQVEPFFKQ